jgi:hypothetical protein
MDVPGFCWGVGELESVNQDGQAVPSFAQETRNSFESRPRIGR